MNEKFHWKSPTGVEIVLPHMNKMSAGIIRRHRKEEPIDFIFSVLEEVGDDETLALVDGLEVDDLNDLFESWQKAGAELGKS